MSGENGSWGQDPVPVKNSPFAVASLVLGLVGIVVTCFLGQVGEIIGAVLSIAAIVFTIKSKKDIAGSEGRLKGKGMATAGLVLSIISLVLIAIAVILLVSGVDSRLLQYAQEMTQKAGK